MIKKVLVGLLSLVVIACVIGGILLYNAVYKDIDEHFAGTCTALPLPGSAEDNQIDRERGFAYMSVLDRAATASGEKTLPGQIMRLDLNAPEPQAVYALLDPPEGFHPHGLSLFIDEAGQRHLVVINHPENRGVDEEHIERFIEQSPGKFKHAETFSSPLITRPNDLVAVGPREFYVAQDTGQGTGITDTLLVYFDGADYTVIAEDIKSGGGINRSADNSTLYVAETSSKNIRVITRGADGGIAATRNIALPTSPDNIDVAEDGSLWIGAHSNLTALVMHFIVGSNAPTQILRVDPNSADPAVEEVYLNKGTEITSGSGGSTWGRKLLIGSITAEKILICDRD
ncbi:MAG: hypothetical protein QF790_09145 [Gammaproteobacteria bacterium]|jgi:arylesterase/paraoxonase|nr:hypothetical protein [Gammaproteobacteria bacterium]MDP6617314.1 hypothetical protein [Gammaproteobacteria bacterium]MDP6694092.1 hypothetical protein [Gammaproteobacteria bacterium]MDP7041319.1 hypothetical protein [Gammaproteobacteria bacterium]